MITAQATPDPRTRQAQHDLGAARVSPPRRRVAVIAGALLPPRWLPAEAVVERLPTLAGLWRERRCVALPCPLPADDAVLPRELAHDRWLRAELAAVAGIDIDAGAMYAVRRLAAAADTTAATAAERDPTPGSAALSDWLAEPTRLLLARDHLLLDCGAARSLDAAGAAALHAAAAPLADEHGLQLEVLDPQHWRLRVVAGGAPLCLQCASPEAAAGRNIDGYSPAGPDARRLRRFVNEIQMTWHARAERAGTDTPAGDGDDPTLAINSVWITGPATAAALAAWRERIAGGRCRVDERLLAARLADDRSGWLAALADLDAALGGWLQQPEPVALLLCGDGMARWLEPAGAVPAAAPRWSGDSWRELPRRLAALAARWRDGSGGAGDRGSRGGGSGRRDRADAEIAALFTEPDAS